VQITAEDVRVLVGILRVLPDRTQAEMAAAAHLHPTTVGRYEHGETIPDRRTLQKLAAAVPLPMWAIDGLLLPVIAVTRALREGTTADLPQDLSRRLAIALNQPPSAAASAAIAEFLLEPAAAGGEPETAQRPAAEAAQRPAAAAGDADLAGWEPGSAEAPPPAGRSPGELDWWPELEAFIERVCTASVDAAARPGSGNDIGSSESRW